jgi:hypothetical protein
MINLRTTILLAATIFVLPSVTFAQNEKPSSKYQEILKRFDKNENGKLDTQERAELMKAVAERAPQRREYGPQTLRSFYGSRNSKPQSACMCGCAACRPKSRGSSRGRSHGPTRGYGPPNNHSPSRGHAPSRGDRGPK